MLTCNFSELHPADAVIDIEFTVEGSGPYRITRADNGAELVADDDGDLIYQLEHDLVIAFQLANTGHVFIHGALLVRNDKAHLLVGRSGAGKSTTTFGLARHGFEVATDEMVAINGETGELSAFAHALCMKRQPPTGYELPPQTISSARGVHVPLSAIGHAKNLGGLTLGSIFCVEYKREAEYPSINQCSPSEAIARVYPNVLNALAHENKGLSALGGATRNVPTFTAELADLSDSCELLRKTVDDFS